MFSKDMLKDRVVLVTGANQGLGFAMASGLAKHGANIFNVGIGDDTKIKDAIHELGREYEYYECDLSKPSAKLAEELVERCVKRYGKLDILLNNAGANRRNPICEFKEEDWDFVLNLNLKNVFCMAQAAAKQFIKQESKGKIINIASMLSFTGGYTVPAYTASKSGVMGLTKSLANELSPLGINVNAIAPGYMATPMNTALMNDPERNRQIMDRLPIGCWGDPSVLEGPVVFLASDEADYLCGITLPVDGGWLSR